ncbi:MAG: cell division FtsA domain-containing protein [Bacteroidales bacterium]|nr:cell division FtsA domain-containing protein [Bacteroidales bacterium]MDY4174483.1 cell division FtsA domain-containing protein [Bacteroidales bacterium]
MESSIIAIDLGTSTTRIVAAVTDDQKPYGLSIVYTETQKSQGIKRGAVYNKEDVLKVVRNLITGAEKKFPTPRRRTTAAPTPAAPRVVCVNVGGMNFQTSVITEKVNIQNQPVTRRTLQYIENQAENNQTQYSMDDDKVIRLVSLGYAIDNEPFNDDVLTHTGNILEARFLCFKAKQKCISLINSAFPVAPNKPTNYYTSTSAKAVVALSSSLKRDGVVLVDLGAGSTGVAVFSRDALLFEVEIPIGSDTITSDISSALNISSADAEGLKRKVGIIDEEQSRKEYAYDLANGEQINFSGSFYNFVVKARVEEIAVYVASVLTNVRKPNLRDSKLRLVLTGGGSLLANIEEVFADKVDAEVVSIPQPDLGQGVSSIEFAAAVGMASLAARSQMETISEPVLPIEEPVVPEPEPAPAPAPEQPVAPEPTSTPEQKKTQQQPQKGKKLFSKLKDTLTNLFDDETNTKY